MCIDFVDDNSNTTLVSINQQDVKEDGRILYNSNTTLVSINPVWK